MDKSHKIIKVLLVLIVLAAVLFIYFYFQSRLYLAFHCFLLQLSDERSDLILVRS